MEAQARPVHCAVQVPPGCGQVSAFGVRPLGSPGCWAHGVWALPPGCGVSVDVPVVSGRLMSTGPASKSDGGGQSFERLKTLSTVAASTTVTVPSMVHAFPSFGPLLHLPPSHFGQTFVSSVR